MKMDYRQLCRDLFGTDDVQELKKLAERVNRKNPRGAGRKRKFSGDDAKQMEILRDSGMTLNEIAAQFGTSRQIVGRYLAEPAPAEGVTLRMTYMWRQRPCSVIDVDFLQKRLTVRNKTDDVLHRAFGLNQLPTWEDLSVFLRERCFPESRGDAKALLHQLGLDEYDPLQIVEKTHGRTADDDMWLRFRYYEREKDHEKH